ncbi:outer membrane protein [Hoeflea sp.]|uniref:outer membrane protein n=1 Tax=Hoeflea sp. TaxID=1940281 RepID=UPI003B52FFBC
MLLRPFHSTLLASAGIAAILATTPVFAQNQETSLSTGGSGWSGFYAGIVGTYANGESRQDNSAGATTGDYDISGGAFGVVGGHNWQSGGIVYGLEADISGSGIDGQTLTLCPISCYSEADWIGTIRGRLGYDMGRFLPYVTAGVAVSELTVGTRQPIVPNQPLGNSDVNVGLAVGAGVEYALTSNIRTRIEYLYADLGQTTYHIPSQNAVGVVDGDLHMVRGALVYSFGERKSAGSVGQSSMGGWSGAYAGLLAAYGDGSSRQDNSFPATTGDYDISGGAFGLFGGYNWQSGRVVTGLEGDIALSNIEGQTNTNCGTLGCYTEVNWLSTIRGRVGVDMGRFLPYATAGVAIGEVQAGTRTPLVPGRPLGNSDVNAGLVFGAGVDIKLTEQIVAKAEYLRADLGSTIYFIPSQGQIGDVPAEAINLFRIGVSRKF